MGYQDTKYEREYDGDHGAGWWWVLFIFLTVIIAFSFVIVPRYMRARASGKYTNCLSNCRNIETALTIYYNNNYEKYPPALTLLTPDYLRTIPTCPSGKLKSGGNAATYRVSRNLRAYTFCCGGLNHSDVGAERNYPRCDSIEGLFAK